MNHKSIMCILHFNKRILQGYRNYLLLIRLLECRAIVAEIADFTTTTLQNNPQKAKQNAKHNIVRY